LAAVGPSGLAGVMERRRCFLSLTDMQSLVTINAHHARTITAFSLPILSTHLNHPIQLAIINRSNAPLWMEYALLEWDRGDLNRARTLFAGGALVPRTFKHPPLLEAWARREYEAGNADAAAALERAGTALLAVRRRPVGGGGNSGADDAAAEQAADVALGQALEAVKRVVMEAAAAKAAVARARAALCTDVAGALDGAARGAGGASASSVDGEEAPEQQLPRRRKKERPPTRREARAAAKAAARAAAAAAAEEGPEGGEGGGAGVAVSADGAGAAAEGAAVPAAAAEVAAGDDDPEQRQPKKRGRPKKQK
jgi:hypothetical protein